MVKIFFFYFFLFKESFYIFFFFLCNFVIFRFSKEIDEESVDPIEIFVLDTNFCIGTNLYPNSLTNLCLKSISSNFEILPNSSFLTSLPTKLLNSLARYMIVIIFIMNFYFYFYFYFLFFIFYFLFFIFYFLFFIFYFLFFIFYFLFFIFYFLFFYFIFYFLFFYFIMKRRQNPLKQNISHFLTGSKKSIFLMTKE